jgi:hypothetical protein
MLFNSITLISIDISCVPIPNSSNNYGVEIDFFIVLPSFSFWPCPVARAASRVNQALAPMGKIQTSINLWATFGFKAAAAIVTNVIEHLVSPYTLAHLCNDVIRR